MREFYPIFFRIYIILYILADALEVEIPDLFERKKEEENTIICPKCGSKFKLIE